MVRGGAFESLDDELVNAYVCIEHWSTPPDRTDVHTTDQDGLIRHTLGPVARLAMVVACKGSTGAFSKISRAAMPDHPGWFRTFAVNGELHVLAAVRLASDGTWGALRFALNPPGAPDRAVA